MEFLRPISYQDFLSSNGGLLNDNGPWMVSRSYVDDINCGSINPWFCEDIETCLSCWVFPSATQTSYSVSFHTKVAVDRSQYEGAITLEYEWSYTPWFGRDTNVFGKINVTTSVGDNSYTDEIEVGDVTLLLCNYTGWNYTPFKHFGSIYFPVNDTRTIEYIPLAIDITFAGEDNQSIDFYVKGAAFKIITQTTTTIGGDVSPPSSVSTIYTPFPPGSQLSKVTVGALVGGILCTAVIVTLVILGSLLFWVKRIEKDTRSPEPAVKGIVTIPLQTYEIPLLTPFLEAKSSGSGDAPPDDKTNKIRKNKTILLGQQAV
ncbi:hypothetical protein FS842_002695 [Serendipita sp. 407]|nr:hypothetical protein FS842_002695 [Serendipita sp. 407]